MTFAGFPARPQATPLPHVFFSDLLPKLTEPLALAVTLLAFHALGRKKGFPRFITAEDVASEPALAAFVADGGDVTDAARRGLGHAAALGVLLPLDVEREGVRRQLYFLNAPADRRGLEAVRAGGVDLGRVLPPSEAPRERPGAFALYESLIGTLSPLIVSELTEAERLYPAAWIEAAFREAAAQNVRSWRYITRILERWAVEGPDHAKTERDPAGAARYLGGKYGRILKERGL